jgi:hypothetical protein
MKTWVTLSGGSAWAFQLDGIIYRTGYGLSYPIVKKVRLIIGQNECRKHVHD